MRNGEAQSANSIDERNIAEMIVEVDGLVGAEALACVPGLEQISSLLFILFYDTKNSKVN